MQAVCHDDDDAGEVPLAIVVLQVALQPFAVLSTPSSCGGYLYARPILPLPTLQVSICYTQQHHSAGVPHRDGRHLLIALWGVACSHLYTPRACPCKLYA